MSNFSITDYDNLFEAILRLDDIHKMRKFFEDVCTIKELEAMSQRLKVAALLKAGCNYQEVSKESGASTATISRVNKCLLYGSGGYRLALEGRDDEV